MIIFAQKELLKGGGEDVKTKVLDVY